MSINIWTDPMQHAALLGKPVLFTNWLIQRDIIPDGWYCYDLRGTHKSPSTRTTLVDHAADYHAGTVLSPIPLKHEGTASRRVNGTFYLLGEEMTLEQFCEEHDLAYPQDNREFVLRPASLDEVGLFYSEEKLDEALGTVGHLRMDFGHGEKEFWHTWWPHNEDRFNTPEFKEVLQRFVDDLRQTGLLKNLGAMDAYCWQHGGSITEDRRSYGYIAETENYRFCLRCTPFPGEYQGYLYCYDLCQQEMYRQEHPVVGRVTFASGEQQEFTDSKALLQAIREELPFRSTTGFRFETLTDDPEVKKAVDDILLDFAGEDNSRRPCNYGLTETGKQALSRLLGIDSIDEYIRYGGTLRAGELAFDDEDVNAQDASFRDDESTRRYIDTAICKNIQHSLACYESGGHFRHLYSLYEAGELTSAINRIIEDMNHRFLISVLTDDLLSHDLRLTAANLRKERDPEKRTEALDAIDTEAVTQRLMELLDIRNKEEQSIGITTAHIIEIKQYLTALELIVDCPIESADPGIEPVEHILFTQPGMRYCQAQALIHSLLKDEQFSALSEYDKTQITGRILEEVRGRMMEDIVLLETMKAADKDHRVFKLQFEAGEFDMVIYDQKENSCEIFEIKHSSKQVPFQYRHLVDEDKCQRTERRFGPIHGRYILYRGEDAQMENGVQYWNVENYLKALPTLDIVQVQEIGMQSIEPTL